nr:transposase [Nocardia pneumoniae]
MVQSRRGRPHVGRNFTNNRLVVEGMLYRLRTSLPWRDLPEVFGPWQKVWKRHRRYAADGTWDRCSPPWSPWPIPPATWTGKSSVAGRINVVGVVLRRVWCR